MKGPESLGCVTLSEALNLSEPQFSHLSIGGDDISSFAGLFGDFVVHMWKLLPYPSREEDSALVVTSIDH